MLQFLGKFVVNFKGMCALSKSNVAFRWFQCKYILRFFHLRKCQREEMIFRVCQVCFVYTLRQREWTVYNLYGYVTDY